MWKERVNALLSRATGHTLQRVHQPTPASRPVSPPPGPGPAAPAPHGAAGAARPKPRVKSARDKLPMHYDDEAKTIILRLSPGPGPDREKLFGLILATRHLVEQEVPGAFVECGAGRAGSMPGIAMALASVRDTTRELHLFDTFDSLVTAADGLAEVQQEMSGAGYPQELIHLHQGTVAETVPDQAPESIALLRLGTDSYPSTQQALEHLYDRLSPGGVLVIDDYGRWDRARLATQEFLAHRRATLLLLPHGTGRIGVKPRA